MSAIQNILSTEISWEDLLVSMRLYLYEIFFFLPKQVIFLNQQVSSSFMLPQITKQVMSELNEINICYYFNEKCYVSIRIWSNIILRRNENINLTSLPLPLYLQFESYLTSYTWNHSHLKLSGRYSHHKLSIRMLWWLTFHIAQVSWFYIAQWESHLNILRNEFGGANLLFSVDLFTFTKTFEFQWMWIKFFLTHWTHCSYAWYMADWGSHIEWVHFDHIYTNVGNAAYLDVLSEGDLSRPASECVCFLMCGFR